MFDKSFPSAERKWGGAAVSSACLLSLMVIVTHNRVQRSMTSLPSFLPSYDVVQALSIASIVYLLPGLGGVFVAHQWAIML